MKMHKHNWIECIRNYRFHSIFLKNFALIVLIIMLPFSCVFYIFSYSYNEIQKSEEKAYTEELRTIIYKDIESLFNELQDKMVMIAYEEDVQMFYHTRKNQENVYYNFRKIETLLEMFKLSTDIVEDIYLYAPKSEMVMVSSYGLTKYDTFYDISSIEKWQNDRERFRFLERTINRKKESNLCMYYEVQYSKDCSGVVILLIDVDKLNHMLDYGEQVHVFLLGSGQILYDSEGDMTAIFKSTESLLQDLQEEKNAYRSNAILYNALKEKGLEIVLNVNCQHSHIKVERISSFFKIFIGVMLLITVILVFYISKKIFDPLSEVMKILESTPKNEKRMLQNRDELSFIKDSIYSTISRSIDVEQELAERIALLKKAQAVALQAQINPHFINNTLETINWMTIIRLGGANEISEMLNCLAKLMRISLMDTDTFVSLEDEINYVETYLFIQQKRLEGRFEVLFDIPQELKQCAIIKMILQPVVENAINYGIIPYHNQGVILITAEKRQERVFIKVKDSGLGMSQEEADQINASIRQTVIKESTHIGLSNVNQRLILAFGDEYGVKLDSKIGYGTVITIEIPYLQKK